LPGKGLPLGNVTSQLFANIYKNFNIVRIFTHCHEYYLNELDRFIKHTLRIKYYLRYADDFIVLSKTNKEFPSDVNAISRFLGDRLKLTLHPNKILIKKLSWGIDFCGYLVLPHYILPRTKTKRRILKKIGPGSNFQALYSYLGYFSHASSYKLSQALRNQLFGLASSVIILSPY